MSPGKSDFEDLHVRKCPVERCTSLRVIKSGSVIARAIIHTPLMMTPVGLALLAITR